MKHVYVLHSGDGPIIFGSALRACQKAEDLTGNSEFTWWIFDGPGETHGSAKEAAKHLTKHCWNEVYADIGTDQEIQIQTVELF